MRCKGEDFFSKNDSFPNELSPHYSKNSLIPDTLQTEKNVCSYRLRARSEDGFPCILFVELSCQFLGLFLGQGLWRKGQPVLKNHGQSRDFLAHCQTHDMHVYTTLCFTFFRWGLFVFNNVGVHFLGGGNWGWKLSLDESKRPRWKLKGIKIRRGLKCISFNWKCWGEKEKRNLCQLISFKRVEFFNFLFCQTWIFHLGGVDFSNEGNRHSGSACAPFAALGRVKSQFDLPKNAIPPSLPSKHEIPFQYPIFPTF